MAKFRAADGRVVMRSTKQENRNKAQKVADKWEEAARKARSAELTQAASVKVLSELMEITTGDSLKVETIAGFLRGWVEGRRALNRADATAKRYSGVVESFLAHLGPTRSGASIASLTAGEIEAWRNDEIKCGKGLTTADFELKVLRAALNAARRRGLVLANAAEAVESAGGAAEEREPFTVAEVKALLGVANEEWRGMILLGAFAGLRIADAANLTWNELDLKAGTLTFQPNKTRRTDSHPLTIALHSEVITHFSVITRGVGNAPLFPSLHGRKPGSHGGLSNEFGRLMVKAGVDRAKGKEKTGAGRRFRAKSFHSLRHTMISRLAEAQVSEDVRKLISGHDSESSHKRYVHLGIAAQRTAIAKLSGISTAS